MSNGKRESLCARSLAVHVLLRMEGEEQVQAVLDTALRQHKLLDKEAGLCTELVYGYLRNELRLNYILDKLLTKRDKLPREMQLALGLAAYALLFLYRVPHHATVHWTVDFVRRRFGQRLSSVGNGVLRSLQRLESAPLSPDFYDRGEESPQYYSLPEWIAGLWRKVYGKEAAKAIMLRSVQQPWNCIRLNPLNTHFSLLGTALNSLASEHIVAVGKHGWAFAPGHTPREIAGQALPQWVAEGACSWQAAGSQEVVRLCLEAHPPLADQPLWDACCGQGGKSLALMEQGISVALCSDVHSKRLRLLPQSCQRLTLSCPPCVRMSAQNPALSTWQGNVLLDVPCSGLGTMARRPEIRSRRTETDVQGLVLLQRKILESIWAVLGQGFSAVYMTCTLNPAENETQVSAFLKEHAEASLLWQWQTPHDHLWLEGMYAAIIQKG